MVEQEHVDFCFVEIAMVIALFLVKIRIALSSCIALSCALFHLGWNGFSSHFNANNSYVHSYS
jgi:hypothetical protein